MEGMSYSSRQEVIIASSGRRSVLAETREIVFRPVPPLETLELHFLPLGDVGSVGPVVRIVANSDSLIGYIVNSRKWANEPYWYDPKVCTAISRVRHPKN